MPASENLPDPLLPVRGELPRMAELRESVARLRRLLELAEARPRVAPRFFPGSRTKLGPLLARALEGVGQPGFKSGLARHVLDLTAETETPAPLPVALSVPRLVPEPGERWPHYKQRVGEAFGRAQESLRKYAGLQCAPVYSANVLTARAVAGQIEAAVDSTPLDQVEFDPLVRVIAMDDALDDIGVPALRQRHPVLTGAGVRVAVLDSGIDLRHPWLRVADSVSTCGEDVGIPGLHGTHVAGSIASRDAVYGGIAPDAVLLNIKVITSLGYGTHTMISRGIDEALDRQAQVLCVSLSFNHLPTWSDGGHGWSCPDGNCALCLAVNNAVALEKTCVVVAAGNEHARAEWLRANSPGAVFDTELTCPGQANGAITVAAHTKRTYQVADFSSRGPTAFATAKPDLIAPGVNITSAIPVRRDAAGNPLAGLTRADLSGQLSGTSMATPMVAGAVALIIQRRQAAGLPVTPAELRAELLQQGLAPIAGAPEEVGGGRLLVSGLS